MFDLVKEVRRLPRRIMGRSRLIFRNARIALSLRRIHGPVRFDLAPDDVVVVVLVRNSLFYLDRFISHYRSLGVRHFVFVDNGSTDGTVERLREEEGCITLRTSLTFYHYQVLMRDAAARRYVDGHWALFVDTDEILEFAGSDVFGLPGLVRYMAREGHTAMVAQMLEMFPKGPLAAHASQPYASVLDNYRYYDLGAVVSYGYRNFPLGWSTIADLNDVSDDRVELMVGGVRAKVFGENCGLSKHPLVFMGEGVRGCAHPHCAAHVTVSDVTGVFKHYKFTDRFLERDRSTATVHRGHVAEARARSAGFAGEPDLSLYSDDAIRWSGVDSLYEQGFLVQSKTYAANIAEHRAADVA